MIMLSSKLNVKPIEIDTLGYKLEKEYRFP